MVLPLMSLNSGKRERSALDIAIQQNDSLKLDLIQKGRILDSFIAERMRTLDSLQESGKVYYITSNEDYEP